jgi:membrane dipeptidase
LINLSKDEEERAMILHREAIVIDMHSHGIRMKHIPLMKKGGLTAVSNDLYYEDYREGSIEEHKLSIYEYNGIAKRAFRDLSAIHSLLEESQGEIFLALKADDIRKAKRKGKIAMWLSLEGGKPLEGKLYLLRSYYRLGVRLLQFTINWRNQLADGCVERKPGGLTEFGVEVVREMNKLGMLIGVAHMADPGFFDLLELTKDPVVASHVGSRTLRGINQNLTDERIKALAENGGVIGQHFNSRIVKNSSGATINDILDHIDYFADVAGIDHVGLGPDFMPSWRFPESIAQREQRSAIIRYFHKIRPQFYWLDSTGYSVAQGTENMWADLPNVTKGLVARGYSDQDIKKILGGNILRVFERVIG